MLMPLLMQIDALPMLYQTHTKTRKSKLKMVKFEPLVARIVARTLKKYIIK